jgi:hypothetical protein
LIRGLGLLLVVAGVTILVSARRINDRVLRINRESFGWEGGKPTRAYGLMVTLATGLILLGLGVTYLVQGVDDLPG